MFLFFILNYKEYNREIVLKTNSLSNFGSGLFENSGNSSLTISNFSPIPWNGYEVSTGLTFISDSNCSKRSYFPFEAFLNFSGKYFSFAPKVRFNCNIIRSLFTEGTDTKCEESALYVTVKHIKNNILLTYKMISDDNSDKYDELKKLPFVYRTFNGNLTGISKTIIKSETNDVNLNIFQPMPDFCKIRSDSLKTTCNMAKITDNKQMHFQIKGSNCSFWYEYKCTFVHWSSFPQNPERGFILGPLIIEDEEHNIFFGNIANLILPTPDFSMIYNSQILTGLVFSVSFTIILKLVMKEKKKK